MTLDFIEITFPMTTVQGLIPGTVIRHTVDLGCPPPRIATTRVRGPAEQQEGNRK
jgi:hypothetical protein